MPHGRVGACSAFRWQLFLSGKELPVGEIQKITDTRIEFGSRDVTLSADIDLTRTSYTAAEGLGLGGSIVTLANGKYVDNYDLYLVAGNHTSVAGNDSFNDAEMGHSAAIALGTYETEVPAAHNVAADRDFNVQVPASVISQIDSEGKGDYTLFAKANYKNDLTPTFHAMTPIKAQIDTGVSSILAGEETVKAGVGFITVAGFESNVRILNLQGATVYNGGNATVELPAGIYIVNGGNTSVKVAVR